MFVDSHKKSNGRWWEACGTPQDSSIDLSVLVPAYNSEATLRQCLSSLSCQGGENIEFICINDGSTDNSLFILKEYASCDKRFVIISKENSGYGASMNLGLAYARGRYVGILEADDWIESGAFQILLGIAADNGFPDIVKANHSVYQESTGKTSFLENFPESVCGEVHCPKKNSASLILTVPAIWAAIYRKDFLAESRIDFLESPGAAFQDTGFVVKCWIAASSVYLVHDAFLNYRSGNEGSSTVSKGKALCVFDEWESIDKFVCNQEEISERMAFSLEAKRFQTYQWNLKRVDIEGARAFIPRARQHLLRARQHGLLDASFYTPEQWKLLCKWIDNPAELLLDQEIGKREPGPKRSFYKLVRKLRKLGLHAC